MKIKKFIIGLVLAIATSTAAYAGAFKVDILQVIQSNPVILYLASGANTVERQFTDWMNDRVDVFNYMTAAQIADVQAGTATLDVSTPINNAISANVGHQIYFPPGTYSTTSPLDAADNPNVYIKGAGVGSTIIKPTAAVTSYVFRFGNTGSQDQGISDLTIDNSLAPSASALQINAGHFYLNNIAVSGANIGFNILGGTIQYFTNFTINNSVTAGIHIAGGNDNYFTNGVMDSPSTAQPTKGGIWVEQSDAFWAINLDLIHQGDGMLLAPGSGQYITWPFVMNSAFDTGNLHGIHLSPTGTGYIKGATFIGNWTSTNDGNGFYIDGTGTVDGVRVIGHRSFNNTLSGYTVAAGNFTNLSFNDDDASGNSKVSSGTYSGFDMGAGVSGFSITNCRSGQEALFANTQSRGIIVNPGASNSYVISGNDLRGNINNSLYDLGTGTTKIVKGNLGYNPIANTAITVTASPFTWTNNTGDTVNVYISGGTVSSVVASPGNPIGSATGMSAIVPQGQSVTVTYSAAPTMSYNGF